MEYQVVKWLHILSSTLLFGTGLGSAFYMLFANVSRNVAAIAVVSRYVVIADWVFTTTTAIFQPASGAWMMHLAGYPMTAHWIMWSIGLYVLAGACWLPVVWIQIRLRDMARAAARDGAELPPLYWKYFRTWVLLGIPAFIAFVFIFWFMVSKPT